ncbi:MAG: O-antigen ligase family protein [Chloroflexi bacterium]|nr:O-antigen ligase family protein [Chloroflexota bacterium]
MTWLVLAGQIGTLAIAYTSPTPAVTVAAALAFIGLAAARLDLALAIALAAAPFYLPNESNPLPPRSFGFDGRSLALVECAILACTAAWMPGVLRRAWRDWRAGSGGWAAAADLARRAVEGLSPAVVAFAVVATASLVFPLHLTYALREYRTVVFEPLLFYAMLPAAFRGRPMRLGAAYVGIGAGVGLVVLAHYGLVGTVESTGGVGRALAIYHSPNALALFLERPLTIAAVLGLAGAGRRRLVWLAGAGVMALVLVLTYSRGAWLAVTAGLLLALVVASRHRIPAAAAVLAAGIVGLLAGGRVDRLGDIGTAGRRVEVWLSALAMVRDHPLTGVGLDNFLYYYRDGGYLRPAAAVEPNISHPHNLILDWWLRLGVLGPVVFGWLVATFFRDGFRVWRGGPTADQRALALAVMAAMVTGLVHGLVDNSFFLVDLALSFWVLYSLIRLLDHERTA